MIKYAYTPEIIEIKEFNAGKNEDVVVRTRVVINKTVIESYPKRDILDNGLAVNRPTSTIQKGLTKAIQGEAEAPIIAIEERWFKVATKVLALEEEKYQLEHIVLKQDNDGKDIPLTEDELEANEKRLKELNGYSYTTNDGPRSSKLVHVVEGLISKTRAEMLKLEEANKWLKAYRGEETDAVRPNPAANAKIEKEDVKKLIAHERDLTVRNSEDSIADVAKMVSLAFSVIATLWELTPDDAKDNISADKKGLIDYAVFKFNQINTRADRQIAAEGTALVDKLYDREVAIADIVDKVKEETN